MYEEIYKALLEAADVAYVAYNDGLLDEETAMHLEEVVAYFAYKFEDKIWH